MNSILSWKMPKMSIVANVDLQQIIQSIAGASGIWTMRIIGVIVRLKVAVLMKLPAMIGNPTEKTRLSVKHADTPDIRATINGAAGYVTK